MRRQAHRHGQAAAAFIRETMRLTLKPPHLPPFAGVAAAACLMAACKPRETPSKPAVEAPREHASDLAAARLELARNRIAADRPGEGLAWIASALLADPTNEDARAAAFSSLEKTTWSLPELRLSHRMAVEQLRFLPPSTLWVSLNGRANTTVRWNLERMTIEAVLFPTAPGATRSLTVDPSGRFLVVERQGFALLCDAVTLKPIRDLGSLPPPMVPASVIAFSPDELLLAHPAILPDGGVVWHLRESKTGTILRSSAVIPARQAAGLAASLDRKALVILMESGTTVRMPVSPVEPITETPHDPPLVLRHARFTSGGQTAVALMEDSPHERPQPVVIDFSGGNAALPPLPDLLENNPWSRGPTIWSGLMRDAAESITWDAAGWRFPGASINELASSAEPTALAMADDRWMHGDASGAVWFHRPLPRPSTLSDPQPATPDAAGAAAFANLAGFAGGMKPGPDGRPVTVPTHDRHLLLLDSVDTAALFRMFPALDFTPWIKAAESIRPDQPDAEALAALDERLARAMDRPAFPEIEEAFANADEEAVIRSIQNAGSKGPAAAKCLELALASTKPEWIDIATAGAEGLPPLLKRIAVSRIAWLQDRKADAISGWPDAFPDLTEVRLREDWDGWEAADFRPALENLRLCVGEELAKLEVLENATAEQRQALFDHLVNPSTIQSVGKPRFAKACLKAALAFSAHKEETEKTFQLASLARNLGESPAVCLRAEAMALTALGDYVQARDRWVNLITNHPVDTHEPGDYAEAAYTSFENADPRQAMAILTTGIHRFPHDANFALRAGWVALLTGNPDPAYRFLIAGRQIGYPEEKLENATALMAIAAMQTGAHEDAAVFYEDLIRMDEAWRDPNTIETLEWPEELKASLRQLAW